MVIFGYNFDLEKMPKKMRQEAGEQDGMHTCYSVSRNHVYAAVFGVVLSTDSCLFSPLPLSQVDGLSPTGEQRLELKRLWAACPAAIRAQALVTEPDVYLFEDTDD